MIGVLTNTSLMVLTNSLFDVIRSRSGDKESVALLGVFVIWERIMVTIKYLMESLTPEKSHRLVDALKQEEHRRNENWNKERENAKKERRSSRYSFPRNSNDSSAEAKFPRREKKVKGKNLAPKPKRMDQLTSDYSPSTPSQGEVERSPLDVVQRNNAVDRTQSKKKSSRKKTPAAPPKTPKAPINNNRPAVKVHETNNSPFKQYMPADISSPLLAEDHMSSFSDDESGSVGDMLSLYSGIDDDGYDEGYRTPLKPSMARSISARQSESELHAADERIRNRLTAPSGKKLKKR